MPITNEIAITPSTGGGGGGAVVPEGVYQVEVFDITYIPGEQNQFGGKPQLKFRFKILNGEQADLELVSWVSLTLNPGWDQGSPSNLYKIAVAVMGEEPSMEQEFYPSILVGGKLQVVVESKRTKGGKEFSRITNYLKASALKSAPKVAAKPTDDQEPAEKKVPF